MSSKHLASTALGIALAFGAWPIRAESGAQAPTPSACLSAGDARRVEGKLLIETPITRAVWQDSDGERGGIEIEYLGPTTQQTPAASGRVLRQIGLRLRGQDPCNAIYVMWPVEPEARLRVMTKINEGLSTFAECGARGYRSIVPQSSADVAPLRIGEARRLEAMIVDDLLTVTVDGRVVWTGRITAAAAKLSGYTGLRTDNVRMRVRWLDPLPSGAQGKAGDAARPTPTCRRRV